MRNSIKYCSLWKPSPNDSIKVLYTSFLPTRVGITEVGLDVILPELVVMWKLLSVVESNRFNSEFIPVSCNSFHDSSCRLVWKFHHKSFPWNSIHEREEDSLVSFLWNNEVSLVVSLFFPLYNKCTSLLYPYSMWNNHFLCTRFFLVSSIFMQEIFFVFDPSLYVFTSS